MPWMEEFKAELNQKVNIVGQFEITEERLKREVIKRKKLLVEEVHSSVKTVGKSFYQAARRYRANT